jgi:hypothetical protein
MHLTARLGPSLVQVLQLSVVIEFTGKTLFEKARKKVKI